MVEEWAGRGIIRLDHIIIRYSNGHLKSRTNLIHSSIFDRLKVKSLVFIKISTRTMVHFD